MELCFLLFAFFPYCTGDLHAGSETDVTVEGVSGAQQFVGFDNVDLYLQQLTEEFPNLDRILLTGSSAGAYGATFNYVQVAEAFEGIPVDLVNDSGPLLANDELLAPCLQKLWIDTFGYDQTLPADFVANSITADGDGLSDLYPYLSSRYPEVNLGLLSHSEDLIIREFYAFGQDQCANVSIPAIPEPVSGELFTQGLLEFRAENEDRWSTFYDSVQPDGTDITQSHTFLPVTFGPGRQIDGITVKEWLDTLLAGGEELQLGPEPISSP